MITIAVFTFFPELRERAQSLAKTLQLPYQSEADYLLLLTPHYLGLQKTGEKTLPLFIDFTSSELTFRRKNSSMRQETLIKALGLKNNTAPFIVDATAGLGRDSFILASFGFPVTMLERSAIIYALVNDGIQRGLQNPATNPILQRMNYFQTDAITWLKNPDTQPDIIYIDPMFPERKKTALSKLDMRIFHAIVGDDLDADALLNRALSCALMRVVVKRPRLAKPLAGAKPTHSLLGSSSRFDVYIC